MRIRPVPTVVIIWHLCHDPYSDYVRRTRKRQSNIVYINFCRSRHLDRPHVVTTTIAEISQIRDIRHCPIRPQQIPRVPVPVAILVHVPRSQCQQHPLPPHPLDDHIRHHQPPRRLQLRVQILQQRPPRLVPRAGRRMFEQRHQREPQPRPIQPCHHRPASISPGQLYRRLRQPHPAGQHAAQIHLIIDDQLVNCPQLLHLSLRLDNMHYQSYPANSCNSSINPRASCTPYT